MSILTNNIKKSLDSWEIWYSANFEFVKTNSPKLYKYSYRHMYITVSALNEFSLLLVCFTTQFHHLYFCVCQMSQKPLKWKLHCSGLYPDHHRPGDPIPSSYSLSHGRPRNCLAEVPLCWLFVCSCYCKAGADAPLCWIAHIFLCNEGRCRRGIWGELNNHLSSVQHHGHCQGTPHIWNSRWIC